MKYFCLFVQCCFYIKINRVSIYTNSAHQHVIETVNTKQKMVSRVLFDAIDPSSYPPFAELFFLPLQISYRNGKTFILNKNEGNNQNVENKVSGRE